MQKTALEVTAKYEREAKERLRRMSLIAAGLEAQGQKQTSNRTATTELDLSEHFPSDEPMTLPTTLMGQN